MTHGTYISLNIVYFLYLYYVCNYLNAYLYECVYLQYRSASLSINPACEAGACTDCEYIECTIAIIDGIAQ